QGTNWLIIMEIELKVPLDKDISVTSIVEHISEKFGSSSITITQIDTYFQSSTKDFWLTDEALRLRESRHGNIRKTEMTYKGPKKGRNMKIREEITIEVSDWEKTKHILKNIGFKPFTTIKKQRKNWDHQNITISLDKVEGLGFYLEIEISTPKGFKEIEKIKDKIFRLAKEIIPNYDGQDERRSYLELMFQKQLNKQGF
ncbi:MAG: class IV adenylate cyclase, partial [Candidatus Hermodarchaeota archaeon]